MNVNGNIGERGGCEVEVVGREECQHRQEVHLGSERDDVVRFELNIIRGRS
jgi:hypothetical protein